MSDLQAMYRRAAEEFGRRVHEVGPDQWGGPTPCTEWTVRDLVNHLVVEQLWMPSLVAGQTLEQVGDRFDGDQLGDDPVATWDRANAAALEAFPAGDALERPVHLSYGEAPARHYLRQLTADLTVHAWDLARGIGADERLDPELVAMVWDFAAPQADDLAASGLFDPPVRVRDDADQQSRLLALFGRRP